MVAHFMLPLRALFAPRVVWQVRPAAAGLARGAAGRDGSRVLLACLAVWSAAPCLSSHVYSPCHV